MSTLKRVSVVIPVNNERESLPELWDELTQVMEGKFDYDLVFVDDGSSDGSFEYLKERALENERSQVIRFLANYGKSSALAAGFEKASGDYVVTLDSDLQDDPGEIPALIEVLEGGFDLVSGWKKERRDPLAKRVSSKLFNVTTRFLTGISLHDFNCGLKAYRRQVIKSLDVYGGMHRYIPVIAGKKGFRITEKVVAHRPRKYGTTKFGRERYFHGLFDLLTVLFLSRYTRRPLHLFGLFGMVSLVAGFLINLWVLYLKYGVGDPFRKHLALLVLGVLLLILGVQFISIGLLGEMIAQSGPRRGVIIQEVVSPERPKA
ncbi:MAG: glycosyltransferase family 2 protein [Fidelibacterota bacterium]